MTAAARAGGALSFLKNKRSIKRQRNELAGRLSSREERLRDRLNGIAVCVGCGCTDARACAEGCYWLEVDRVLAIGVCSSCSDEKALARYYRIRGAGRSS